MTNFKAITELNEEELLELLKENPTTQHIFTYNNDVLDFISTYSIKSGENRIKLQLVYNVYKKWSHNPVTREKFGSEMIQLFDRGKTNGFACYYLNKPREYFLERVTTKNPKRNKTKSKVWLKHFKTFIDKYNLKSGSFYVKDIVLYNLYDKWVYKNNSHNPLSLNQFLKFCRLFFKPYKMIKSQEWFPIDHKIQEFLTPELINLMKQK